MSVHDPRSSLDQKRSMRMDPGVDWDRIEKILTRFEDAWRRGERPVLEDYLVDVGPERAALLIELVHEDLEYRLAAGEPARVEHYVHRFPEFRDDAAVLRDLVIAEYKLRHKHGDTCSVAGFLPRFPELGQTLASQLGAVSADPAPPTPVTEGPAPGLGPASVTVSPSEDEAQAARNSPGPTSAVSLAWANPAPSWPSVPGYEILGKLGQGGMGVVYQARQLQLGRLVALKMIRAGSHADPQELARFRTEAEAVAQLKHPNIVQIYEIGAVNGMPFFSLELVDGGSLDRRLKANPLPAREAAELIEVLARAMHCAHQHGIIHRDLKPANILITEDRRPPEEPRETSDTPRDGRRTPPDSRRSSNDTPHDSRQWLRHAKIADFGLAKRLDIDSGETQSGMIIGTPSYMAPEQAAGRSKEISAATDIYALGAVLYDVVIGRPPFKAATRNETIREVLSEEPVPLRRLQPKVPRDLETICLKCLQKDQAKRYATAEALADDLRRFLHGEPIQARSTPAWERALKWARRKPTAAALVGTAVVAAVAFIASITFYILLESQRLSVLQHQLEAQEKNYQTLRQAQKFADVENWGAAEGELEKIKQVLDVQQDLDAGEFRAEVERSLAVAEQKLDDQEQRQAQRRRSAQRLVDSQRSYNEALFFYTLHTGLDIAESRAKTLAAIEKFMDLYGRDERTGLPADLLAVLERDRPDRLAVEQTRVVRACYELLLIWAELEAAGPPGRSDPVMPPRQRADKALALLAVAEQVGRAYALKTRTFGLRKARFVAQSQGEPFDLQAAEKTVPGAPQGRLDWFLLALEKFRLSKFSESIAACDEVLFLEPDDFWSHYVKAISHLRRGDWIDARAEFTVCLSLNRDFVWSRLLRGFALSEEGYRNLLALEDLPERDAVRENRRLTATLFSAARDDFDRALKQDDSRLVQYVGLTNRGVLFIRQKRWPEAVADLGKAVDIKPNAFQGHLNLAWALQGMGQEQAALEAMNNAVQAAPNLAAVRESRARLHLAQENWTQAKDDFNQAVTLEGGKANRLAENLVELGKLLHREEKYADALAAYDRAMKLRPDLVLIQRFRADTLLAHRKPKEAGDALDIYLAASKVVPAEVFQIRGIIHAETKDLPAAIEMYTLALQKNPAHGKLPKKRFAAETRSLRGWAYLLSDAPSLALDDFQATLGDEKTNPDALIGRGTARIRLKQMPGALDDALAAENQTSLTRRLRYNLTRLYALAARELSIRPNIDRKGIQQLSTCKEKALKNLQSVLADVKPQERTSFWRTQVEADPAFSGLRGETLYLNLAKVYGGN